MQVNIYDKINFFKTHGYAMYPELLQIEITNKCPLHCKQCYKEPNGGSDIDFDLLKRVLRDANQCGIKKIMFNGGEPLMYPYIIEALDICTSYDMSVRMVTSGVNLDKALIDKIKNTGCDIVLAVSLNGSTKEIHEISRDGYQIGINALKLMSEEKLDFGINWVSRTDNVYDFPNVVELAKKYNVTDISVITNKIDGSGCLTNKLGTKEYLFLIDFINKFNDTNKNMRIFVQYCFPFLNYFIKNNVNKHRSFMCGAGFFNCCINVHGRYKPCIHLPYEEEFDSIQEFWNKSKYLKKIRSVKNDTYDNCKDCIYKDQCRSCYCMSVENAKNLEVGMDECPVKNLEVVS